MMRGRGGGRFDERGCLADVVGTGHWAEQKRDERRRIGSGSTTPSIGTSRRRKMKPGRKGQSRSGWSREYQCQRTRHEFSTMTTKPLDSGVEDEPEVYRKPRRILSTIASHWSRDRTKSIRKNHLDLIISTPKTSTPAKSSQPAIPYLPPFPFARPPLPNLARFRQSKQHVSGDTKLIQLSLFFTACRLRLQGQEGDCRFQGPSDVGTCLEASRKLGCRQGQVLVQHARPLFWCQRPNRRSRLVAICWDAWASRLTLMFDLL